MNITLIGMPGVGKSFIGKRLATVLGYKFLDIDDVIVEREGKKLQDIIDERGNDEFMEIEERCILELDDIDGHILSPGGSVVYSTDAAGFLKRNSIIVYLRDDFENIRKRIKNLESRGIVGLKEKGLRGLFEERTKLYEKYADIIIDVDEFSADTIVKRILECVR